jgi:hypothetical protein
MKRGGGLAARAEIVENSGNLMRAPPAPEKPAITPADGLNCIHLDIHDV